MLPGYQTALPPNRCSTSSARPSSAPQARRRPASSASSRSTSPIAAEAEREFGDQRAAIAAEGERAGAELKLGDSARGERRRQAVGGTWVG